jgi:2-oxoglutarate ferredoxin oxidoreductase subunit alpha
MKDLPQLKIQHPGPVSNGDSTDFEPYQRNDQLRRPWAIPGTAGLEHRIGGLEKQDITGNVSYDPENHHQMCEIRAAKIAGIANNIPDLEVEGPEEGDILLLGWGGTYGAIASAARSLRESGKKVSHAHLRYLNPMPKNTQSVLGRFRTVLIPELNLGQLCKLIRSEFLVDPIGFNKVKGQPFLVSEIVEKVNEILES